MRRRNDRLLAAAILIGTLSTPLAASAQDAGPSYVGAEVFSGGELEQYLRTLHVAGRGPAYPWSIRGFSQHEVAAIVAGVEHPWSRSFAFVPDAGAPAVHLLRPGLSVTGNTAYPFGANDRGVWAGRGWTGQLTGGVAGQVGPLSWSVAPAILWTQNDAFPLVEQEATDRFPYADADNPNTIDLPQRLGAGSHVEISPGQSTVRVDYRGFAVGVGTANQVWGPGSEYPLILGINAPGFLHGFAGTSHPWDIGIGRLHGRVISGRLEQSGYSTVPADSSLRFATGIVAVFMPRGLANLEVGASYFTQSPWPAEGIGLRPIFAPLAKFARLSMFDLDRENVSLDVENGIAAVFFRWRHPSAGLELIGEFASEDKRHNLRDLALQPDHNTAYSLGMQKVWATEGDAMLALRAEVLNASRPHLARNRRQEPFYIHAALRQGHTHKGQTLGAPAAYQGGGSTVEVERYTPDGRISFAWRRFVRRDLGRYLETGIEDRPDVQHSLGAEVALLRGRWELWGGMTGVYEFTRDFDGDAVNLNATLGVRGGF